MPAKPQPNDWIAAYARVQRLADRDILRLLDESLKDTKRMLAALEKKSNIGAVVRAEQLRTIKRHMLAEQAKIFRKLGDIVSARRVEAASRAVALGTATDAALFGAIGDTARARALGDALSQGLAHSTEVAVTRMTQSRFDLSQRIYRTQAWMDGRIERGINSALARGLSAKEFASEARDWFDPRTPGGVRYAALRLARSEINNAFHAISVNQSLDKPWVHGMQWHLSRSHPKADACDELAHEDAHRMGAGVFPVRGVPRKPHPHCFCYVTPVVESEDEFIDNMFKGKYDSAISRLFAESAGQEPGRNILTHPGTAAKMAKAAKPKTGPKTPAQLLATLRRKATAHAKAVFNGPTTPETIRVVKELQRQAKQTPKSMLKLKALRTGDADSKMGREFFDRQGKNTGAFFRNADKEIHISPRLIDAPHSFDTMFTPATHGDWFVPNGAGGIESVVSHEYGHHIDFLISDGGTFFSPMGDQLFPVLIKELGLTNAEIGTGLPIWTQGQATYWPQFDKLVSRNKSKIRGRVSEYGSSNGRELMAEIWSEYSHKGSKARPWIVTIGKLMQKLAEGRLA